MFDYTRLVPNKMRALRRMLNPVARDWRASHGEAVAEHWVGIVSRCCSLAQASQMEQVLRKADNQIRRLRATGDTEDLMCAAELKDFRDALKESFGPEGLD